MTDEELDEARAIEAMRLTMLRRTPNDMRYMTETAARLAREGWTPTDPDLVLAREVVARYYESMDNARAIVGVREGREDAWWPVQIALAAFRAARGEKW